MKLLLGIDCGSTIVKAAAYDLTGRRVAVAAEQVGHDSPRYRWVERDTERLWQQTAAAVQDVIAKVGRTSEFVAVGVTGHGDGLYLVDEAGRPTRPGILSLDSRAHHIVRRWAADGVSEAAREVTGQVPWEAAPAALLRWMVDEEPEVLAQSQWALACKDVVKMRLTDKVAADPTEASTSFCDVQTQAYSEAALRIYGLADQRDRLAPVVGSFDVMGEVTREAATLTGLAPGTPVVSGAHDVDACAIGSGAFAPGQLSVIAGTYSINQTVATAPEVDDRWYTRNFARPGEWMHMAVSPTSATNLEWFVRELCPELTASTRTSGEDLFSLVTAEVSSVLGQQSPVFLPFLYGSPQGAGPSGAFLGLRGWHRRSHLVAAVMEGVVFNHRWHVEDLQSRFAFREISLTGGGARSDVWTQLFADGLGLPVARTRELEAGTLGAAMCAGIGAGIFQSLAEAAASAVVLSDLREPDPARVSTLAERYDIFRATVEALAPMWARLEP